MSLYLVQGWTERITDVLKSAGVAVPVTGMTIQLVAFNSAGPVVLLGSAGVLDGPNGVVYFDAHPTDFATKGTLHTRWKVTDLSGKVAFWPNAPATEDWIISKA